jgi:hypothetical protein
MAARCIAGQLADLLGKWSAGRGSLGIARTSPGRMEDCLLGGTRSFAVDRGLVQKIARSWSCRIPSGLGHTGTAVSAFRCAGIPLIPPAAANAAMFAGYELLVPGLLPVDRWRPDDEDDCISQCRFSGHCTQAVAGSVLAAKRGDSSC